MIPSLPVCQLSSLFTSANLEDVIGAIELFIIGLISSLLIFSMECCWYHRKSLFPRKLNFKQNINVKNNFSKSQFKFQKAPAQLPWTK